MNINRAQLEAIANGVLDSLGENPALYSPDNWTLEERILTECANEGTRLMKQSLTEKGGLASRRLLQSIDASETIRTGNTISSDIVGEKHWKYFEYGRKPGEMPPIKSIEEWITAKGIAVRRSSNESKQTVLQRRKGMAFAIARKIAAQGTIKRFGYHGSGFVSDVLTPANLTIISELVAAKYGQKLSIYITMGDVA